MGLTVKSKSGMQKMYDNILIVVAVAALVSTAVYILNIVFAIGIDDAAFFTLLIVWIGSAWCVLMYSLCYFFLWQTYLFTDTEIIILSKRKHKEERIRYADIAEILYAKFSFIQILLGNISRVGIMKIAYKEKEAEGEPKRPDGISIPYKSARAASEMFGLNIRFVDTIPADDSK